jgi:aminoglycoside 6'-N-acetyltransferase I
VEVGLRNYAEGCESSPVGYVEGWYVDQSVRRQGVGRALIRAAEDWARSRGCTEIASDTEVENAGSQEAHERLGYERVETIVVYRRAL